MIINSTLLKYIIFGTVGLIIAFLVLFFIINKIGKNPNNIFPPNFAHRVKIPLLLFFAAIAMRIVASNDFFEKPYDSVLKRIGLILLIISITWFLIIIIRIIKISVISKYNTDTSDNFRARRVYTQFSVLERVIVFVLIILAIGIALMSFDSIRSIGASVLASAGIAGIILGFSAQKALGTLLAGIQIAITQPIRLDDVVIVEGEWGHIEEITLTYVVVAIWDKRMLVVPTTYFIEKPFENWTRKSGDILGTVYIYTDFRVPVDELRKELTRLLKGTDLWDGEVNKLQVTDAKQDVMEIRALMSSKDSSISWDLRVYIREKLIAYLQKNYPDSLPRTRISLVDKNTDEPNDETDQNQEQNTKRVSANEKDE
ncbi:mechanosensitive ion channel family protein [Flavobacterium litorale]|uniref:Mechanosensitive ion channel family protein n=1 Tax=Flavobacterium litorale TaxID=2856519 RepID=A0ABX8VF94_9FLAO|nr:mechanosensitive ion channel domain-containing protein [Flavobacterium litorale]QYJ69281.1 mechanosensitive ion channel family protein [Flavobacterium litorale]